MKQTMTPQEMLNQGIEQGDMQLIRQARDLMQGQVVTVTNKPTIALKPTKRVYKKKGKPTLLEKVKETLKPISIEQMLQKEQDRINAIISGKQVPEVENFFVDNLNLCKKDIRVSKDIEKASVVKTERRPPNKKVKKICPRCQSSCEISASEVALYKWTLNEEGSGESAVNADKPVFACDNCLR